MKRACRLAVALATLAFPAFAPDVVVTPVPEPGTILMLGAGVGVLIVVHKLRERRK